MRWSLLGPHPTMRGMATQEEFDAAADRVQKLPKKPSNDDLLELYAFYKQATVGDVTGKAKDRAESTFEKVESRLDDAVSSALGRLGVPSRDEIATLTRRVEELTALVERLQPEAAKKPAAKTAARKPAAASTKTAE